MAFTTPSYSLPDLFARINRGELQLPDFQRTYAWPIDQIHSLVVTVLRGYPIGALLALDTRNEPMRFKPRPIAGAPDTGTNPGLLLLDGQQRLTSLYKCFQGDGLVDTVDFRNKRITRRFFVDVVRAAQGDVLPEDAVFTVNADGEATSHFAPTLQEPLTSYEAQVRAGCVPVDSLLGQAGADLLFDMAATADDDVREGIKQFHHTFVAPLAAYDVPMIRLGRETARAGLGSIFAQANSAGLQMDVFELLTAVFGTEDEDFSLAEDFAALRARFDEYPVLDRVDKGDFLTALSMLVTYHRGHVGGQREDILTLTLQDWRESAPLIAEGFELASDFLAERSVFTAEHVPYQSQIVPLATILALLKDHPEALARNADRLNQWFWCAIFGEVYGTAAVDIRSSRDVDEVTEWILSDDAQTPRTVENARFVESRLLSVDETSGVWHGIFCLLMARGARDWRTGQAFDLAAFTELEPTFEPVFPKSWCEDHGIEPELANSVLNHTPLGKRTEIFINGYDPTRYLPRLQSKSIMEDDEFDQLLASHEIDPKLLHASDAPAFFEDRRERMIGMVEYAIGGTVVRDVDTSDLRGGAEGPDAFAE